MEPVINVVTSWDEFREKWDGGAGRQNFLLRGALFPFQFETPPLEEILGAVRRDEKTRILKTTATAADSPRSTFSSSTPYPEIRDVPAAGLLAAATQPGVNIAHFDANEFAGPGEVLEPISGVFDQWYQSLADHGFTWNEPVSQRAFFYSAPHCMTAYHFDSSYVLACQVSGRKRFCWLKDPERWCPPEVLEQQADHYDSMTRPEGITPDDVIECEMLPGDVLWNIMLTPHWVYALDEPTYSFNLTHFDLALDGEVSPIETTLRGIRSRR